jgi:hypothetical protein
MKFDRKKTASQLQHHLQVTRPGVIGVNAPEPLDRHVILREVT